MKKVLYPRFKKEIFILILTYEKDTKLFFWINCVKRHKTL